MIGALRRIFAPFERLSFRRRLLLLIIVVSMLQVAAAFATFHDTQSEPQRLRYEAQLEEAVNRVLVAGASAELNRSTVLLERAAADIDLRRAVATDDEEAFSVAAGQLLPNSRVAQQRGLYVTDERGTLIAGKKPEVPFVEADSARMDGPAGKARFVHAPALLDSALLGRANQLTSTTLLAIRNGTLLSAKGAAQVPRDLQGGYQDLAINGTDYRVLLRPTGSGTFLGAGVPTAAMAASGRDGKIQLWLFFAALTVLAFVVAWIVTSAVGGALSVFAARARRVADGYLDERIPVVGDDEVASASDAFNTMAAALKDRIEGLEAAEARLDRQVRLFGDVLTSEDAVSRKLEAVCEVAVETTNATQARFWSAGEAQYTLSASVGVSVAHELLSRHEAAALRSQRVVEHRGAGGEGDPSVLVEPAVRDGECLGLITLVATGDSFDERDRELAHRFAAQAAVAIDNARLHDALRDEHHLLASSFSQYVPASVVEQLLERGATVELGGEQREVSVLFCDIRGFTSWSEQLAPTQVVTELNALLSVLSDCVFATDGTLDKFTGDGLMAFWGAPLAQADHADRACRAAMLMQERVAAFNAQRGVDAFRIGVGIHTGPAVVGNIGHDRRHDYTAIGDTVNLSARIEAATKEHNCTVLISESTHRQVSSQVVGRFAEVGAISVKGRTQPVAVHRFLEADAAVGGDSLAQAA